MPTRRALSLLDLVGSPGGAQALIPDNVAAKLEGLGVIDYSSTTSDAAYIHHGTIQALADALPSLDEGWLVRAPGLTTGIPFQATIKRTQPSAIENIEPAPSLYLIDLFIDRVEIELPFLRPAKLVERSGVRIGRLIESTRMTPVKLVGSGTLRIRIDGTGARVRFIDWPDPFDPDAPTGPVFRLSFDPPHFFFGKRSQLGMTVQDVVIDHSEQFTPAEIIARGHDDPWTGISIRQATMYFPRETPLLGDFTVGVRDVLLGSPLGIQGELEVEWGEDPLLDATLVEFFEVIIGPDGQARDFAMPIDSGVRVREVNFSEFSGGQARVRCRVPTLPPDRLCEWYIPGVVEPITTAGTPYFTVREEDVVALHFTILRDGRKVKGPMITFIMREATNDHQRAPKIRLEKGTEGWDGVLYVGGSEQALQGFVVKATPPAPDVKLTWTVEGEPAGKPGNEFAVPVMPEIGVYDIVLTDNKKHQRRIRIDIIPDAELLIGYETGVARPGQPDATLLAVEKTYDLKQFYENGTPKTFEGDDAVLGGTILDVPAGAYAEVTIAAQAPLQDPPPPGEEPPPQDRPAITHVQLLFGDATDPGLVHVNWGLGAPYEKAGDVAIALRQWARTFEPGTTFLLIGRCDDRFHDDHIVLARARAEIVKTVLLTAVPDESFPGIDPSFVQLRAELEPRHPTDPFDPPDPDPSDPPLELTEIEAGGTVPPHEVFYDSEGSPGRRISPGEISTSLSRRAFLQRKLYADTGLEPDDRDPGKPPRPSYRRVDIFAVPGAPDPAQPPVPNPEATLDVGHRRVLVPADDAPIAPKPPKEPDLPYRVRVRVAWDSPTYVDLSDAIPTLAEVSLTWQASPMPLPAADPADEEQTTQFVACKTDPPTVPEYHTVVGRFTHDARSGDTIFSFAWSSEGDPNGLKCIPGKTLATAAALGPALMPGITTASRDDQLVRIAALIAISKAVSAWAKYGEVVIHKIELEQRMSDLDTLEGSKQRIMLDYSVELGVLIDTDIVGIQTKDDHPLRVRYKNVGLAIDVSQNWWEAVSLVYDDVSFEIENPGGWSVNGPLGDLLRVTAFRAGTGSTWFEVDLAFALDLGVITISKAIIRVVLDESDISIQLRGFEASVSIPEVLEGTGRLDIGSPPGTIKGALELLIIPADIMAKGSLVFAGGFFFLQIDTQFSSGLPIASSGLGIFGFSGRFVVNGARALPAGNDPVQRELDWYALAPVDKYVAQPGQWAIGVGAIIGSMPDRAFVFHANAMLAVSWPDPSVVFGADATFVKKPPKRAVETHPSPPPTSARIVGLVAIDPTAVKIGLRGSYTLPKLIDLKVPVSGYFPLGNNPDDFYLRIGSDGIDGRVGQPIKATVLPDSFDLEATAFLMIEEKKLHNLGGHPELRFDGFSVGFGVRASVDWSVWPVSLSASAEIYAGLGSNPFHLAAGIYLKGSLDLGPASVDVSGSVVLDVTDDGVRARGEICGEVDLWLCSISGCLDVEFGDDPETLPPPPSPLLGVDLTDRFSRLTGAATKTAPAADHTVWPDTIPVLHFSHYVRNDLPATAQFKPPFEVPGPRWVGTSDLQYAFRLVDLTLEKADGTSAGDHLSAMWEFPSYRSAISTPDSPPAGKLDGRDLALLTWHPARWARNLGISGGNTSGDPANTIDGMCDPAPVPVRVCAFGKNLRRVGVDRVVLTPDAPSPGAFSSWFRAFGRETLGYPLESVIDLIAPQEMQYHPGVIGAIRTIPRPDADPITEGYVLPYITWRTRFVGSAGLDARLAPALVEPELTIQICPGLAKPLDVCDSFTGQPLGASLPQLVRDGVTYASLDPQRGLTVTDVFPHRGDRSPELAFPPKGMQISLPRAATSVTARVVVLTGDDVWTNIELRAYNSANQLVATQKPAMQPNQLIDITAEAADIRRVELSHAGHLISFCYTPSFAPGLLDAIFGPDANAPAPRVIGTTDAGVEHDWVFETGAPTLPPTTIARAANPCVFVRYKPKHPGLTWRSVRIAPYRRTRITVVSICGVTWEAQQGAADDQETRDDLKSWLDGLHLGGKLAQRHVLESNTEYRVRAKLEYQVWRKSEGDESPPSTLDETAWRNDWPTGVEEVYRFRTAPATPAVTDPVNTTIETAFDARAVKRHLIGFTPDTGSLPHFLDDSLGADFDVDHLEVLLGKYNRLLGLKLRRTDPPAGSRVETPTADEPITTSISDLAMHYLALSDLRMVVASVGTLIDPPCAQPFPPEGTHISIDADLEPDASYDLLLCAPPQATPLSDDVLIARAHFHTSHYRSPAEMMAALGFAVGTSNPYPPQEAIVDADLPTTPVLADDRAFDEILGVLGLDPWPLAKRPRTTVLWRFASGAWLVAGVLLETNEALERGERMGDLRVKLDGASFTATRSNAATTRILFAPAAASPAVPGSVLSLIVRDRTSDLSGTRTLVAAQPVVVEEVA
jgi:hypothetical protein